VTLFAADSIFGDVVHAVIAAGIVVLIAMLARRK